MLDRLTPTIAVDFDGTLCVSQFPEIGEPNWSLINYLIWWREQGNKLILWTCRGGKNLENAVKWCSEHGLEFDAVNENIPERTEFYGNDSRKVGADYYIDDYNAYGVCDCSIILPAKALPNPNFQSGGFVDYEAVVDAFCNAPGSGVGASVIFEALNKVNESECLCREEDNT